MVDLETVILLVLVLVLAMIACVTCWCYAEKMRSGVSSGVSGGSGGVRRTHSCGGSIGYASSQHMRAVVEGAEPHIVTYDLNHSGEEYPYRQGGGECKPGGGDCKPGGGDCKPGGGEEYPYQQRASGDTEGAAVGGSTRWGRAFAPPRESGNRSSGMRNADYADEILAPSAVAPAVIKRRGAPTPKQHWQQYVSWDTLKKDAGASAEYFQMRTSAVNNPDFEWGQVHEAIKPMLEDNREHVGIIGLKRDGRTLKVIASEPSPDAIGEGVSSTYFAGVPAELVAKYAERPALFFFHTHPADERANPLPSSPDLATAIYFGATARFAASVVFSRYGILVYGISWSAYKSINSADDWKLALMNFTHDTITAHEGVRSWGFHSLPEYLQLYPRMRLTFYAHPSSAMVAANVQPAIMHSLESEIDHRLIGEYAADIARHVAGRRRKRGTRPVQSAQFALPPDRMPYYLD